MLDKQRKGLKIDGNPAENPKEIFHILEKLGEGSYGAVLKALDTRDQSLVAIKSVPVDADVTALQREIDVLKECDSAYIVAYKGSYRVGDHVWIVMEYCHAGSAADLMAATGCTLTEPQIAVVCRACLQGLAYLHSKRLIHRDVKCGNILLTAAGDPKLADFGVSAHLTNTRSKRGTKIGTPYWMAPEVLSYDSRHDEKADIWSMGITAYEMAVGHPPLTDMHPLKAMFLIPKNPPPTLPDPDKWSKHFHEFLAMCLVKEPDKRTSATELLKCPFIRNAVGKKQVLKDLVDQSMPAIQRFREAELGGGSESDDDKDKTKGSDDETETGAGGSGFATTKALNKGDKKEGKEKDKGDKKTPAAAAAAAAAATPASAEEEDEDEDMSTMKASGSKSKDAPTYMKQFDTAISTTSQAASSSQSGGGAAAAAPAKKATFMECFLANKTVYPVGPDWTFDDLEKLKKALSIAKNTEVDRLANYFSATEKQLQVQIKLLKKTAKMTAKLEAAAAKKEATMKK